MKRRNFLQGLLGLFVAAPVAGCASKVQCDVSPAPAKPEMRLKNGSTIAFVESEEDSYIGHAEYPWRSMRDGFVVEEGDIHKTTHPYWRGWDPCKEVYHDGVGNEITRQEMSENQYLPDDYKQMLDDLNDYSMKKSAFTPDELEAAGKAALDFYLSNKPVNI